MHYLSVCSGIEAATQAWDSLGWKPWAFSEIEKFPSAVLAHHYPDVPNLGDMTKYKDWPNADLDVLCGGTPCQSFSVAGLRQGLDDPRGNLMLTYGAIAGRYRPRWLAWENVPGVLSSNGGRDFGTFLGMLGQLGYGVAYRVLDAQHVRTRRFPYAVPQRRRRVFVVGYLGDWRRAAAVLFDRESLSGHPAPRRQAGQGFASSAAPSLTASGRGVERIGETRGQDPVVAVSNSGDVGYCLTASAQGSLDAETETMLAVSHALRGEGFDASEDGTGRATPLVPVAFDCKGTEVQYSEGVTPPLRSMGHNHSHSNAGGHAAVAFDLRGREGGAMPEGPHDTASIRASSGGSSRSYVASCTPINTQMALRGAETSNTSREGIGIGEDGDPAFTLQAAHHHAIALPWAVRRLTPTECERLMGFPDGFTQIPWRGKPAENCPDGPRYKALGNSWAVNCADWIGGRIAEIDQW